MGTCPKTRRAALNCVDPETVLRFKVEKHGEEYWAVWGKKRVWIANRLHRFRIVFLNAYRLPGFTSGGT